MARFQGKACVIRCVCRSSGHGEGLGGEVESIPGKPTSIYMTEPEVAFSGSDHAGLGLEAGLQIHNDTYRYHAMSHPSPSHAIFADEPRLHQLGQGDLPADKFPLVPTPQPSPSRPSIISRPDAACYAFRAFAPITNFIFGSARLHFRASCLPTTLVAREARLCLQLGLTYPPRTRISSTTTAAQCSIRRPSSRRMGLWPESGSLPVWRESYLRRLSCSRMSRTALRKSSSPVTLPLLFV